MNTIQIEYPSNLPDYSLLDSGNGEKLETFGGYTIIRPDPRAIWQKSVTHLWDQKQAEFIRTGPEGGTWKTYVQPPKRWLFHYQKVTFLLRPTDFKHVGIFPEQAVNWYWMTKIIDSRVHQPINILNLFAYTGGATVVAAKHGAHVTHVDSSKSTIDWAHENFNLNNIDTTRVRWIEDDAYKFVLREQKRGKIYDAVIMDPPRFGRGSKGEIWKLDEGLPKLLMEVKKILSPESAFVLINAYTADLSSLVLKHLMEELMKDALGTVSFGELATKETSSNRLLPQGIFSRWQRNT